MVHDQLGAVMKHVDELLRLFLAELVGGARADPLALRRGLAALDPASLTLFRTSADTNRVLPALGFVLDRGPEAENVPDEVRVPALQAWQANRLRNRVIVMIAGHVQQALEAAGGEPILYKGIHYVDWLWPDIGARRLQDLDLVMPGVDVASAAAALRPLQFEPIDEPPSDAVHLRHPMDLEIDLHHRFRLFEGLDPASATVSYTPRFDPNGRWRVFEPERELATLIHHHCSDHMEAEGARLCWIADLALRLRIAEHEDIERVCALVGHARRIQRISWLVAVIEDALGVHLERWRRILPPPREPADWATVMASNRLLPFGLPRSRGWARYVVSASQRWRHRWGPRPELADLRRLPAVMRSLGGP
jgi:hypothetical protein